MARNLTKRQAEILEYIQEQILRSNTTPSLVEIAQKFGIRSPNGVRNHILALEKKGYITRSADKARSIQLVIPPPGTVSRIITSAKKKIWTKRHYFFYLPVYISLRTRKSYSFFIDAYARELEREVRRIAANHDWEILELTIMPDELTIALIASPDHSVERIVRNLKNFTLSLALKHPVHFHGKQIWASGFAASTDRWGLNQLREHHRQSLVGKDDQSKQGES